jgi:hypothetical protein
LVPADQPDEIGAIAAPTPNDITHPKDKRVSHHTGEKGEIDESQKGWPLNEI